MKALAVSEQNPFVFANIAGYTDSLRDKFFQGALRSCLMSSDMIFRRRDRSDMSSIWDGKYADEHNSPARSE